MIRRLSRFLGELLDRFIIWLIPGPDCAIYEDTK